MAQVTSSMIASIIDYADRGVRYPLTVNELRQLAYMASVSDGSLKGQDAQRLDPKDDSAVGNAETPFPSPPTKE
jgi:hypothetical protein